MNGHAGNVGRAILVLWIALCLIRDGYPVDPPPQRTADIDSVVSLLDFVIAVDPQTAAGCLATLRQRVQSGEVEGQRLESLRLQLSKKLRPLFEEPDSPMFVDAVLLSATWRDERALRLSLGIIEDARYRPAARLDAMDAVAAAADPRLIATASRKLRSAELPEEFAARLLAALARYESAEVARLVLDCYPQLAPPVQPKAVELLTQRRAWSRMLLEAILQGRLAPEVLNVNQVNKLLASRDARLAELVRNTWGTVRQERSPQREEVLRQTRSFLEQTRGNASQGRQVFDKICGQCHRIHGSGQDVGPDISRNGRGSFEQLLSNVLDPSLVIGAAYQAQTVITLDGRVLTGLIVEDSSQRIVLKTQGGKLETIPRDDVDEMLVSKLSLMPEGVEKQLEPQQLADLFAFLTLDKPPSDPEAALIPGTPVGLHGKSLK